MANGADVSIQTLDGRRYGTLADSLHSGKLSNALHWSGGFGRINSRAHLLHIAEPAERKLILWNLNVACPTESLS